ncbi:MAG TPA: VOC family protein [Stellaceae bacterium]|jgi:catechol 2,3-dioxygenase-like lactoylglutathione lyase family enzyme|nr:VOC family protein [Stellaceae bacterium]
MGKLRHLAIVVKDLEASCRFYETCFDMKRAFTAGNMAVYLTDGVMNLAVLNYATVNRPGAATADGRLGIHHFGFRVDDLAESQARIEAAGGQYCFDFGDPKGMNFERKFTDPEGILFDISEKGWFGAVDEAVKEKEPAAV